MKTLETLDGDLIFENGDFKIIEGEKEIAQCIAISLGTNLKEWFLNEELGIDFSSLLGKSSQDLARAEVMRVLAQEERVNLINNVEILDDRVNRKRTILFSVQLANGELLEDEVVISA